MGKPALPVARARHPRRCGRCLAVESTDRGYRLVVLLMPTTGHGRIHPKHVSAFDTLRVAVSAGKSATRDHARAGIRLFTCQLRNLPFPDVGRAHPSQVQALSGRAVQLICGVGSRHALLCLWSPQICQRCYPDRASAWIERVASGFLEAVTSGKVGLMTSGRKRPSELRERAMAMGRRALISLSNSTPGIRAGRFADSHKYRLEVEPARRLKLRRPFIKRQRSARGIRLRRRGTRSSRMRSCAPGKRKAARLRCAESLA